METASGISYKKLAGKGAIVATAGVLAYSLLIMTYSIIRSSITIFKMMPAGERQGILFLNGFSIAYSVVVFSVLMAGISAIGGAFSAVILKKSMLFFNPFFNKTRAVVAGSILSMALTGLLYILFRIGLRSGFNECETLLFWWLFPSIIFCIACIQGSIALNIALQNAKHKSLVIP